MIRKLHCIYAQFICISIASSSWLPVMNGAFAGDVRICGTVASIVSSCTTCTLSVLCTWPEILAHVCTNVQQYGGVTPATGLWCARFHAILQLVIMYEDAGVQVCSCCTKLLDDVIWAWCAKPGASVHSAIHSCACQSVALCGPSYTVIHV